MTICTVCGMQIPFEDCAAGKEICRPCRGNHPPLRAYASNAKYKQVKPKWQMREKSASA